MKKTIGIFFIILFTSTATEFHEFYRLPFMVYHYIKHKEQNSQITFSDFLKIHYLKEVPADNDDAEDNKLPFKGQQESNLSSFYSGEHGFTSGTMIDRHSKFLLSYYTSWIPSDHNKSIFRPPRQVLS